MGVLDRFMAAAHSQFIGVEYTECPAAGNQRPRGEQASLSGQRAGLADGSRQPPPRRMRPVSAVAGKTIVGDDFMVRCPCQM
jgi:hypothetical protein